MFVEPPKIPGAYLRLTHSPDGAVRAVVWVWANIWRWGLQFVWGGVLAAFCAGMLVGFGVLCARGKVSEQIHGLGWLAVCFFLALAIGLFLLAGLTFLSSLNLFFPVSMVRQADGSLVVRRWLLFSRRFDAGTELRWHRVPRKIRLKGSVRGVSEEIRLRLPSDKASWPKLPLICLSRSQKRPGDLSHEMEGLLKVLGPALDIASTGTMRARPRRSSLH